MIFIVERLYIIDRKNEISNMYKLIIWDLDGTLIDTTRGVVTAVKETLLELGLSLPNEFDYSLFVGPPMQDSFSRFFNQKTDVALANANKFRKNYSKYVLDAELYPNCMEVLDYLKNKGYLMAVATNKSEENAKKLLGNIGISCFFDVIYGSDLGGKLNKSDIIRKCIEHIRVDSSECLYVGDSSYDLVGANKNDVDFVAVTYGFGFARTEDVPKSACKLIINDLEDIRAIL